MNLKEIFKKHYDIIIGFAVFVSYKFYFTTLLFSQRGVPPEPDDSYFYLASAANAMHPQNFEDFRLLPFSLWIKLLSLFTRGNLESAYQVNFYIGPIIMFAALAYFLHKLEASLKIRLLLFALLTLYSGSGSYHGFYWVVPSFYQLAMFFVMFTFVISEKQIKFWKILPFSFAFIFIHPTSIFISAIFIIYPLILRFLQKESSLVLFKNTIVITISIIIPAILYFLIGYRFPPGNSPESFQGNFQLVNNFLSGKLNPDSFPVIWREYFSILWVNPVTTIAYFAMFYFVFRIKQYKVIAIFLSALLVVFLSAFIPYGWRTLGFLWPVTFIVIGYSISGLYLFLKIHFRNLKFTAALLVVVLFFFASILNMVSIKSLNARHDYEWDRQCPSKINDKNTFFFSQEAINAFTLYGFDSNKAFFLSTANLARLQENSVIVKNGDLKPSGEKLTSLEKFVSGRTTRRRQPSNTPKQNNSWTIEPVSQSALDKKLAKDGLKLKNLYNCGYFLVNIIQRK